MIQTHKLDLLRTISSTIIWQHVNRWQHWTSLPTFWWFCFRLQSDIFLGCYWDNSTTSEAVPRDIPPAICHSNTASAPVPRGQGRIWSGGWRTDLASADVIYSQGLQHLCSHSYTHTRRRDRWHKYKVTHTEHSLNTCSLAHLSQWGSG